MQDTQRLVTPARILGEDLYIFKIYLHLVHLDTKLHH